MAGPIECLRHLQQIHEEYEQDKKDGVFDAVERHRRRAGPAVQRYLAAVQVQKDLEDLL